MGEVQACAWLVQQGLHSWALLQPVEPAPAAAAASASAVSLHAPLSASASVPCCVRTARVTQMQRMLVAVVAQPALAATLCAALGLFWTWWVARPPCLTVLCSALCQVEWGLGASEPRTDAGGAGAGAVPACEVQALPLEPKDLPQQQGAHMCCV